MDREVVRLVVAALVGMSAVSLAAVSLDSENTVGSQGGSGFGGDERGGIIPTPEPVNTSGSGFEFHIPIPEWVWTALVIVMLLVSSAYLLYDRGWIVPLVLTAIGIAAIGYLLGGLPHAVDLTHLLGGSGWGLVGMGDVGLVETNQSSPSGPSAVLLLGITLAVAVIVLARSPHDGTSEEDEPDPEVIAPEAAAIGRAAGRRADRIESTATIDNEVYRAWKEMTELLDASDPETSTPAEFADAAVDAGMDPDDVEELTRLFEDVRYGTTEPSEEYERRAISVLRRIERRYE